MRFPFFLFYICPQLTHNTTFGRYAFVAVDATPKPGPRRPYNFFGHMPRAELDHVQQLLDGARSMEVAHTIVFGHYPIATVVSGLSSTGSNLDVSEAREREGGRDRENSGDFVDCKYSIGEESFCCI